MNEMSELDELAVRQMTAVERFIGDQNASKNFVVMKFATDQSTGAYPQALQNTKYEYFEDDGDPYRDRFPKCLREPIQLKLAKSAKWTDVLSTDLWSEGLLINEKALAIFKSFDLGSAKSFPAEVTRGREKSAYQYLFIANHVTLDTVDFTASEFYIADMIGTPRCLVSIVSAEDFSKMREQISAGEIEESKKFCRLEAKKIRFHTGRAPSPAIFALGTVGVDMYVRKELYEALRRSGITGLEFVRNNRLFDD